jgi:hypothetical protein
MTYAQTRIRSKLAAFDVAHAVNAAIKSKPAAHRHVVDQAVVLSLKYGHQFVCCDISDNSFHVFAHEPTVDVFPTMYGVTCFYAGRTV